MPYSRIEAMKQENITAIIPAFNEEKRIGRVLNVVTKYPFCEIIVVNDGSTDRTEDVIANYPVKYIKNSQKMGKGYSMDLAAEELEDRYLKKFTQVL
jgi:glycosyltransferase involved in cell wall biosynthesis